MNKKTIIIIIVAIVVIGGVYYGVNSWRQQQILKQVYGLNAGLLSGNIPDQIAKEIAKQGAQEEAQQAADVAKEAAKTPADKYNATQEMAAYDANSQAAVSETKTIMEKVFGQAKLTAVSTNVYDAEKVTSSIMEFTIARLATGADLTALTKALTDRGLPIIQSGIDNKSATVMAGSNDATVYSFGFEIDSQTVNANIISYKK
jgi:hypothetical protein